MLYLYVFHTANNANMAQFLEIVPSLLLSSDDILRAEKLTEHRHCRRCGNDFQEMYNFQLAPHDGGCPVRMHATSYNRVKGRWDCCGETRRRLQSVQTPYGAPGCVDAAHRITPYEWWAAPPLERSPAVPLTMFPSILSGIDDRCFRPSRAAALGDLQRTEVHLYRYDWRVAEKKQLMVDLET